MDELGLFIQRYGFPALFALWLMLRMERRVDRLTNRQNRTILMLTMVIQLIDPSRALGMADALDESEDDDTAGGKR